MGNRQWFPAYGWWAGDNVTWLSGRSLLSFPKTLEWRKRRWALPTDMHLCCHGTTEARRIFVTRIPNAEEQKSREDGTDHELLDSRRFAPVNLTVFLSYAGQKLRGDPWLHLSSLGVGTSSGATDTGAEEDLEVRK